MSYLAGPKDQYYSITTGTTSNNSNTVWADVTGTAMYMMANTAYRFQFDVIWYTAATTTGIAIGVNGPASPTSVLVRTEIPTSLTAVTQGMARAYNTGTATTRTDLAGSGNPLYARCYGYVVNGATAGNLSLSILSEVNGSAVTVAANTLCRMWRVNPSN